MLEGLDKIDWASHRTMFGSAEEVPHWIRGLASEDAAIRERASDDLSDTIEYLGGMSEVASYVVPFIIELLQSASTPEKSHEVGLLCQFSGFFDYPRFERDGIGDPLEKRSYEAVREAYPLFLSLLEDQDPKIRRSAFMTLSKFKEYAVQTASRLRTVLLAEPDEELKANMVVGFGGIMVKNLAFSPESQQEYIPFFRNLLASENHPLIKLAAALVLVNLRPDEIPLEGIEMLEDATATPSKYYRLSKGGNDWYPPYALLKLSAHVRVQAFINALNATTKPFDAQQIVRTLLDSLFNQEKKAKIHSTGGGELKNGVRPFVYHYSTDLVIDFQRLTPEQRTALTGILDSDIFWEVPGNLLEVYGLPSSRERLRELLKTP